MNNLALSDIVERICDFCPAYEDDLIRITPIQYTRLYGFRRSILVKTPDGECLVWVGGKFLVDAPKLDGYLRNILERLEEVETDKENELKRKEQEKINYVIEAWK